MTSGRADTRYWYICNLCHEVHDPSKDRSCHPYDSWRDYSKGAVSKNQPVTYIERPQA